MLSSTFSRLLKAYHYCSVSALSSFSLLSIWESKLESGFILSYQVFSWTNRDSENAKGRLFPREDFSLLIGALQFGRDYSVCSALSLRTTCVGEPHTFPLYSVVEVGLMYASSIPFVMFRRPAGGLTTYNYAGSRV